MAALRETKALVFVNSLDYPGYEYHVYPRYPELIPYVMDHPLVPRCFPVALDEHITDWDFTTPCGWQSSIHTPLVEGIISRFRPPHPIATEQDSPPTVVGQYTPLLVQRETYGPFRLNPAPMRATPQLMCPVDTRLVWSYNFRNPPNACGALHWAPLWTPPQLFPPERIVSDSTEVFRTQRGHLFDEHRFARVRPAQLREGKQYPETPRIVFTLPGALDAETPPQGFPVFSACVQASALRFLMGLCPQLAHFNWEVCTAAFRRHKYICEDRQPVTILTPESNGTTQCALLVAKPIMSAESLCWVALAMGGKEFPRDDDEPGIPSPDSRYVAFKACAHKSLVDQMTSTNVRVPKPTRYNIRYDNGRYSELSRRLERTRGQWSRSFGHDGVVPLWSLSREEQARSFEHFEDIGGVAARLRNPPDDLFTPFGVEITLPSGRALILEHNADNNGNVDLRKPVHEDVEPCALYTSGVSSAWLVDLFEAVILAIPTGRPGAMGSNRPGRTLFTVVFRTFHVDNTQPTPVYKARLFLAVTWRTSHNHGPVDQSNPMGKASVWQYHTGRHNPFPRYFPDEAQLSSPGAGAL